MTKGHVQRLRPWRWCADHLVCCSLIPVALSGAAGLVLSGNGQDENPGSSRTRWTSRRAESLADEIESEVGSQLDVVSGQESFFLNF